MDCLSQLRRLVCATQKSTLPIVNNRVMEKLGLCKQRQATNAFSLSFVLKISRAFQKGTKTQMKSAFSSVFIFQTMLSPVLDRAGWGRAILNEDQFAHASVKRVLRTELLWFCRFRDSVPPVGKYIGSSGYQTRMLGSIVWHLASPTQDGMKHPEMYKKVKVRKNFLEVKNTFG